MRPGHLDLFSGIGGFAIAAGWAGFETIGFSEVDEYASKVLARHWPNVRNYGDIRNIKGQEILKEYGAIDLITGGFPCQPFSVAGKQRGKEDDRFLWPDMLRVISEVRPTWVLGENVAGIVKMELDTVLSEMEGISYECQSIVIPACAVDAQHRRDRVWILASYSKCLRSSKQEREHKRAKELKGGSNDGLGARQAMADANSGNDSIEKGEGGEICQGARGSKSSRGSWWPPEPAVGRMANGLPNRSHRLKALGNAIVPQVAYEILKLMNP